MRSAAPDVALTSTRNWALHFTCRILDALRALVALHFEFWVRSISSFAMSTALPAASAPLSGANKAFNDKVRLMHTESPERYTDRYIE